MSFVGPINPIISTDASYIGLFYAYEASGGFAMEQGIASTTIYPYETINRYDVTNSLQIKYDVRTFNEKIGLIKDASNENITNTTYNSTTNNFAYDNITISAGEFSLAVDENEIISVGIYSTLYSNFQTLINNYFGFPEGFTSLFTTTSQMNLNGGIFDASAMVNLMNYKALDASGQYVNTMTGSITIGRVNALLRYASQNNPFNNRPNHTIEDGFIENDLIYVTTGTTITVVAKIINSDTSNNTIIPTTDGLANIIQSSPGPDFTNGPYSQVTTFTSQSITRIVTAPILIVLKNLS
jgi:hypothetical protein